MTFRELLNISKEPTRQNFYFKSCWVFQVEFSNYLKKLQKGEHSYNEQVSKVINFKFNILIIEHFSFNTKQTPTRLPYYDLSFCNSFQKSSQSIKWIIWYWKIFHPLKSHISSDAKPFFCKYFEKGWLKLRNKI